MDKYYSISNLVIVGLFIFFIIFWLYNGFTTIPREGDSLTYHIPIAQDILSGNVLHPSKNGYALNYYPGASEGILAVFILTRIPLNLYNFLSWLLLIPTCYFLARVYGLKTHLSLTYTFSVSTFLAVFQLIPNQTIDIWLVFYFSILLFLLNKPKRSLLYFLTLGLFSGLLIGSKFSGPIYLIVLLVFFAKPLAKVVSLSRIIVFFLPFTIVGLSWYIRNLMLTGNPLYPQGFLFLEGNNNFDLLQWVGWKTLLLPFGLLNIIQALFVEYLLWGLVVFLPFIYFIFIKAGRIKKNKDTAMLIIIGFINTLIFFILPSTADNIVTYLRYLFPAIFPLVLAAFLLLKSNKYEKYLIVFSLLNGIFIITQLPYRPKIFIVTLAVLGVVTVIGNKRELIKI